MAACSERELERKSPFSSKPFTTITSCLQYSENDNLKSSKMSKTAEANQNTQAINNLSDEDFENLLKDAYQDRKLKNTDNVLLKSIIQECEEKDKEEKDIDDLTFLTEIFQTKKSKHTSKIKNDHSHKKRLEDLLPSSKTKNCIINVSSKHSSLESAHSHEDSFVGAKTRSDAAVSINHFQSSKDLSSVNSSLYSSSGKSCGDSSSLDIEMQELKPRVSLEDGWDNKASFHHHRRRKSDGDGSKDGVDACCMGGGCCPHKKSDILTSQQPLHKSASDFSVRDSSDILNKSMDINGNPMKCGRQHSSRQMSEFSNCETTKWEGKMKQANKKNQQKGVVTYQSEDVENFRGNLNLEQLISFINTSGKKGEKLSKTISSSLDSKNRHNDAADLKKFSSSKTLQTKTVLKGPKRQNSDTEDKASGEKENLEQQQQEIPNGIFKNEPSSCRTNQTSDKSASSILANSSPIAEDVSGFAADFYTFSDAAAPNYEEEFRVVTKKHRKRRQNKKTDSFRKHNSSSGSNGNILRDLKQDTHRRKSTSSMPPSENSSADNSDLDSVYSLPVSGSVPQTTIRPHTTPSSMSSTPQTSYADITRMSMMNSKEREGYTCNTKARPIGKIACQTSPGDYANGENCNFSLKMSTMAAARREKHVKSVETRQQPPRSTKESVTQTEPVIPEKPMEINLPPPNNENQIKFEKPPPLPHPAPSEPSGKPPRNSIPECPTVPAPPIENAEGVLTKTTSNIKLEKKPEALSVETDIKAAQKSAHDRIPPVTMEDYSTPSNDYNISFGFDFNELELIYLYDHRNGAKELPLPLLPKIRDNTKLLGSGESSERTNVVLDYTSSSPSSPSDDPLNSGHFHDKQDFEKSAQSFNYHQLVKYFKSKWGSFHQDSTTTTGDNRVYMPVIKYSEC